jgi:arsenate reductase (thioredoxin)
MMLAGMPTVLFVCEGNIFRSQIAEAFFRAMAPPGWSSKSAGTRPGARVHPGAIAVMAEVGMDLSGQRPKTLDPAAAERAARVIAMCDMSSCPAAVLARTERWPIIDPAALPPERWPEIRDEIERRVRGLVAELDRAS